MNFIMSSAGIICVCGSFAYSQTAPEGAFPSRYNPGYWQLSPTESEEMESMYPNRHAGYREVHVDQNPAAFHIREPAARVLTDWTDLFPIIEQPNEIQCDPIPWAPAYTYTYQSTGSISSTNGRTVSTTVGGQLTAYFLQLGVQQNWTTNNSTTISYTTSQSDSVTSQVTVNIQPCKNGKAVRQIRIETVPVAYDNFDVRATGIDDEMVNTNGNEPYSFENIPFEMGYALGLYVGSFDYLKHVRLKFLPFENIPGCDLGCGGGGGGGGDMDGDGIADQDDDDMDGDGITNDHDDDMDGDGNSNGSDTDGDGLPDGPDTDNDNDGVDDGDDDEPFGPDGSDDIDNDGIPNDVDLDIDGDGILNQDEMGPDDDLDGDGIKNSDDGDIDGDGIPNEDDPYPYGNQITDIIFVPTNIPGIPFVPFFITLV